VPYVYDMVAKVSEEEAKEHMAKSLKKICAIANVKSSLTLIVSEESVL
jgi:hypothetical protein